MGYPSPEEDDPVEDWEDAEPTKIDDIPFLDASDLTPSSPFHEPEEVTPPCAVETLPGFEPGRVAGRAEADEATKAERRAEGFDVCRAIFLEAFRQALIDGKTDPGVAYSMAERLDRLVPKVAPPGSYRDIALT